jgi:hypothetical protein
MTEVAYLVVSLLLIVALANSSRRSSPPSLRTGGPSTGPIVDESRGEGLLEANEYDRLAGAHGFTERTVIDVLLARGSPRHGGPCSACVDDKWIRSCATARPGDVLHDAVSGCVAH